MVTNPKRLRERIWRTFGDKLRPPAVSVMAEEWRSRGGRRTCGHPCFVLSTKSSVVKAMNENPEVEMFKQQTHPLIVSSSFVCFQVQVQRGLRLCARPRPGEVHLRGVRHPLQEAQHAEETHPDPHGRPALRLQVLQLRLQDQR